MGTTRGCGLTIAIAIDITCRLLLLHYSRSRDWLVNDRQRVIFLPIFQEGHLNSHRY